MYKYLALVLILALAACKKDDPTAKQKPVTFTNPTDKSLTIKIYPSELDYYEETNAISIATIEAGATKEIDAPLAEGREYYFDMHSDDFEYSNWVNSPYDASPTPNYIINRLTYPVDTTIKALAYEYRGQYLGKGNISRTWKAVDAYEIANPNSQWNSMPAHLRDFTITIEKNFVVKLDIRVENGNMLTYQLVSGFKYADELSTFEMQSPNREMGIRTTPDPNYDIPTLTANRLYVIDRFRKEQLLFVLEPVQ